jgi:glucose-6-phosphate isomerase
MTTTSLWSRFQQFYLCYDDPGVSLDISRMNFPEDFFTGMAIPADRACLEMRELEAGAIANPDEDRMVGHYWLRNPDMAPEPELKEAILSAQQEVAEFAAGVHDGTILAAAGGKFTDLLVIGIGGSALGPELVADALWEAGNPLRLHFFDNTDPDGMDRVLASIGGRLATTMVVVISKSGGTKETRNGMIVARAAFEKAGIPFAKNFVAVTGEGSELDRVAAGEGWLRRFPMWDWVGGRTSVMSAVGLLPMALQGVDTKAFLAGAAAMDARTRTDDVRRNAAMLLALMWWHAGGGTGAKDMVILPYMDRLLLFSRYLQQLVMESLGKELDRDGNLVNQGIAVYGNKGSTDQHAYVQQLRDGVDNFFVTFIEVRRDSARPALEVEPGITSGDYLQGFLRGTRAALHGNGRESITISIAECDAYHLGALIALFERAVGFYASFANINAYDQPGVEAGKMAAAAVLAVQARVVSRLRAAGGPLDAEEIALAVDADPEEVFHILEHLAANRPDIRRHARRTPTHDTFEFLK